MLFYFYNYNKWILVTHTHTPKQSCLAILAFSCPLVWIQKCVSHWKWLGWQEGERLSARSQLCQEPPWLPTTPLPHESAVTTPPREWHCCFLFLHFCMKYRTENRCEALPPARQTRTVFCTVSQFSEMKPFKGGPCLHPDLLAHSPISFSGNSC